MIQFDKPRFGWKMAGITAVLALAGLATWLGYDPPTLKGEPLAAISVSPLAAYSHPSPESGVTGLVDPQTTTSYLAGSGVRPLHPNEPVFQELLKSKDLSALAVAYNLAEKCLVERELGVPQHRDSPDACSLAPNGKWLDPQLRKTLIEAKVNRPTPTFGTYEQLRKEGPEGPYAAFKDDPQKHAELMAKAFKTGVEKAEPTVLVTAAGTLIDKGNALLAAGKPDEARAAYREAAKYTVARAINHALQNGADPDQPVSLSKVPEYQALMPKFSRAEQQAILNEGRVYAARWSDKS